MKRKNIISYILSLCMLAVLLPVACSDDDKVENATANSGLATVATAVATSYSQYEATLAGSVITDGSSAVTEWGICVGDEPSATEKVKASGSKESFTVQVTNLEGGKLYYYRAYAINASGISYGDEKIFTTEPILPILKTTDVVAENTRLVMNGELKFDGGISLMEQGFCYGIMAEPTLENGIVVTLSSDDFKAIIDDVEPFTDFYVRAYAINAVGITYGDIVKVTTGDHPIYDMPYSENFSKGKVPPAYWRSIDKDGDGNGWFFYKFGDGTTTASSRSYQGGALTPNNFLITPRIRVAGNNPVVRWKVQANHGTDFAEHYKLVVSEEPITDANCENPAIVKTLHEETLTRAEYVDWGSRTASLSGYEGKVVFLAWVHYNCSNMSRMYVTNIEVRDVSPTDPTLFFPENFDGAVFPPADWTIIDHDGDGDNWVKSTSSRLTVGAMSDSEDCLTPHNLLVTPPFLVTGTNPTFSWEAGALGSADNIYHDEHFKVVVSILGNTFEDFDESKSGVANVFEKTMDKSYSRTYVTDKADLTQFIGKVVYVAIIHYNCSNEVGMVIKNVNFSEN